MKWLFLEASPHYWARTKALKWPDQGDAIDIGDDATYQDVVDVIAASAPTVVVNALEVADVARCEINPKGALQRNAIFAGYVAMACRVLQVKKLIHVSTSLVFGSGGPFVETDEPFAQNTYGATKLMGENLVQAFNSDATVVRVAQPYPSESFPLTEPVMVPRGQRGTPTSLYAAMEAIEEVVEMVDAPRLLHLAPVDAENGSFFDMAFPYIHVVESDYREPVWIPKYNGLATLSNIVLPSAKDQFMDYLAIRRTYSFR